MEAHGLIQIKAIAGSAMISNAPGTVADIVDDDYRAMAFSIWSIGVSIEAFARAFQCEANVVSAYEWPGRWACCRRFRLVRACAHFVSSPMIANAVFSQYMGWRWTNWVVMIGSGVSFLMVRQKPNHLPP